MPRILEHSATSWKGQEVAHKRSVIDGVDPRVRLVVTGVFALVVVINHDLVGLSVALLAALATAGAANLKVGRTIRRVLAMDLFMVFLLIMLPFTVPGEPLFEVAGLGASAEGFRRAFEILLRANAIILVLLALVGTMDATVLGHALARLRLPLKLVHLLLFTVRYLDVISREYQRMRKAMKARAFTLRSNSHTWRSVGHLIGMLLVRSLERSERILAAMKCRGFRGQLYLLDDMACTSRDSVFAAVALAVMGLIVGISAL
jgi:cobalt/nickel transport system permease protein